MPTEFKSGWIRQEPDPRDFTIKPKLMALKKLPASVDLRSGCPRILDQKSLGSCTANAGVGLVDFCLKKDGHPFLAGARLFLYYATRVWVEGSPASVDTGATIRGTLKALAKYGVCPESIDPYVVSNFSKAPTTAMKNAALNNQALRYALLDAVGVTPPQVLTNVKSMLSQGFPCEFGFDVYSNYSSIQGGLWPYPSSQYQLMGGHAVMAVGYDDNVQCPGATKGALLCRNSWGTGWGLSGYFYLPYDFIIKPFMGARLATDFWVLVDTEWLNQ